jgi:hypothetical protein
MKGLVRRGPLHPDTMRNCGAEVEIWSIWFPVGDEVDGVFDCCCVVGSKWAFVLAPQNGPRSETARIRDFEDQRGTPENGFNTTLLGHYSHARTADILHPYIQ